MKLARVIGNIVSTIKTNSHQGHKLLVVQPIDHEGKENGESLIAIDASQAGISDIVLVVEEGSSAREVLQKSSAAVDAVIVGVVDRLEC